MAKLKIGNNTYIGDAKTIARFSGKSVSEVQSLLGGSNSNTGSKNTTTTNKPTNTSSGSSGGSNNTTAGSAISRDGLGSTKQYTGGGSSGGTGTTNSQYTGVGTHNDANVSNWAKKQINYYKEQYNNAIAKGDKKAAEEAHLAAEAIRERYGYSGGADGSDYIVLPDDSFEYIEEKPEYSKKYDPQIDALLNQILNREDFSYNVMNDPLYQQYAAMYRREGDRAMKETMAEAAAGAGGMNTYAITAAQQANNYYNSQLNDKIPELYQLAYEMYLQEKENEVQDLGLLQSMDATQYNRYRDTMNDWYNDRNFAYGVYRDDVADSQWKQTFDNNNYWANKEFDYNVGRDTIADNRYKDETDYNRNQYDQKTAKEDVKWWIAQGIMPDKELIKASGLDETSVRIAVEQVKSRLEAQGITPISRSEYEPEEGSDDEIVTENGSDNNASISYQAAAEECERIYAEDGKDVVMEYIYECARKGALTPETFMLLIPQYNKGN